MEDMLPSGLNWNFMMEICWNVTYGMFGRVPHGLPCIHKVTGGKRAW